MANEIPRNIIDQLPLRVEIFISSDRLPQQRCVGIKKNKKQCTRHVNSPIPTSYCFDHFVGLAGFGYITHREAELLSLCREHGNLERIFDLLHNTQNEPSNESDNDQAEAMTIYTGDVPYVYDIHDSEEELANQFANL